MNAACHHLTVLSKLLEYPGAGFEGFLREAGAMDPAVDHRLIGMRSLTPDQREELYTATFDVSPSCVPYVSIRLFGEENFKRGEFMAGLLARYAQCGFSPQGELPDHLSVLLRFAAEAEDAERRELVEFCILGPLTGMITGLSAAHPYRSLLEAIESCLRSMYPDLEAAISPLDQMRRHGASCAPPAGGCGCGGFRIQDGPDDESALVTDVSGPRATTP